VLHAGRNALREAEHHTGTRRGGLVLGNLGFPSESLTRYAEYVWFEAQDPAAQSGLPGTRDPRPHPLNRFHGCKTARFAASALGMRNGGVALDAACASSLYAVKLACDQLHDGSADVMLAGGVNCADSLFVHVGFRALGALSATGRSRPFDRAADGLVLAEGAVVFTLERLPDAVRRGVPILGVIRGVGLSNDGGGRGLLVPSADGQYRAMAAAYRTANLAPDGTSFVECHGTGTQIGDATEVRSMQRLFAGRADMPIGSVKANLGHLVTAAGGAGVLKVVSAMAAGVLPPTVNVDDPIVDLRNEGLRVVREPEPWSGSRRAGVSAFGFGGNNAHLVVEPWDAVTSATPEPTSLREAASTAVAVVALAVRAGKAKTTEQFTTALLNGTSCHEPSDIFEIDLDGLHFPPMDLASATAQQTMLFAAAGEALGATKVIPSPCTMVLVGMQCDPEIARHGASWRIRARMAGSGVPAQRQVAVGAAFTEPLDEPAVLGAMPNLIANRVSSQFDLGGPAFVVSDEHGSSLAVLDMAVRALDRSEADAVVVGGVDLSHEPVHRAAMRELGHDDVPAAVAVVMVLKRLIDARRDGETVITPDHRGTAGLVVGDTAEEGVPHYDPRTIFGSPHAARGMLAAACGVVATRRGAIPQANGPARPSFTADPIEVAWGNRRIRMRADQREPWRDGVASRLHVYSGADRDAVLAALAQGRESSDGPARLAVFCADDQGEAWQARVHKWLADGGPRPAGVAFRNRPVTGQVAFVYTNGAAAYPGMGRELLLAFPETAQAVEDRTGPLAGTLGWAHSGGAVRPDIRDRMLGVGVLGCFHTEPLRTTLGVQPDATIGHSSGESGAFIATGVWADVPGLLKSLRDADLFAHDVAGEFRLVREVWRRSGISARRWANYAVSASPELVRAALADEPAVHLMAVNSPESCTICGDADAAGAVFERLGIEDAVEIPYGIAVHAPEVEIAREQWARLHRHETSPVSGIRFYSCVDGDLIAPEPDSIAEAIACQAVATVDFAGTVERAYADGVRIFIENGPRAMCTGWISSILGDREHVAVAMDVPLRSPLAQLETVVAELSAAGVELDIAALSNRLITAGGTKHRRRLTLAAHPTPIELPIPAGEPTIMAPAPALRPPDLPAVAPVTVALPASQDGRVGAYQAVARAHQTFLTTQSDNHLLYLEFQANLLRLLVTAGRAACGQPATIVQPALPAQPAEPALITQPDWQPPAQRLAERPAAPAIGPTFDRAQLEYLSHGRISDLFGPAFRNQDDYPRQTRMPRPPLLLADRVTGIDAVPGSMGTGTIWTETDVLLDGWYLDPAGRMAAGLMIEAGQADLLLISWLGIDLLTKGDRVYRLLDCDLTFHGPMPVPGETIRYEIRIEGHTSHGDIRLFFFNYDCWVDGQLRLTMRGGQAGYFTDQELADAAGVQRNPAALPAPAGRAVTAAIPCQRTKFNRTQLAALADGRPADCFGPGWEATRAHVRTPQMADRKLSLLHEVTEFDAAGGPWRRGYLRATTAVAPDDWFFEPHFKNDPCMPGTLILEAGFQAMGFFMTAMGFTVDRDGWRFEPVSSGASPMRCRGQVTPMSRELVYEIFVADVSEAPSPHARDHCGHPVHRGRCARLPCRQCRAATRARLATRPLAPAGTASRTDQWRCRAGAGTRRSGRSPRRGRRLRLPGSARLRVGAPGADVRRHVCRPRPEATGVAAARPSLSLHDQGCQC
jgi:acyl transferase domain-containing protein/3-hydroxymyristoyl/3-hydroxydecanoyl-(acyl carrier protein) dehydratase